MKDDLTEDTKAITLLCGVLGSDSQVKPLSLTEYSTMAKWLMGKGMRPGDLLQKEIIANASQGSGIDQQRLESLIGRGGQLGFAVEEWQRNGIFLLSRSDSDYPARYKQHLKDKAPPLLFGAGNRALLSGGGLAVVGSRNVDQTGEDFTRKAAEFCAYNNMPVVSGGARGVDQISMTAALEAGGVTIGVLADTLLKKSLERKNRKAIADGRLLLLSPYHPNARFTVGTAMGRNKLIYAMADYCLVVSAEHKKGGTWAGAQEELKRKEPIPVFVRTGDNIPPGNSKLLDLGAIPWPCPVDRDNFRKQLQDLAARVNRPEADPDLFGSKALQGTTPPDKAPQEVVEHEEVTPPSAEPEVKNQETPTTVYQAVLPLILKKLATPTNADELTRTLDVNKTQLNAWLKRAVQENKIKKMSNPVRYKRADTGVQGQLWQ